VAVPFRRVAGMQIGLPRPLGRLGQELQQHTAGAPAVFWTCTAAAPFLTNREPHPRRDLFRPQEIFVRGIFQAAASSATRPGSGSCRGPDRWSSQGALAEQRAGVWASLSRAHRSAHRRATGQAPEVHDQERHRAVGLGLQDETAVEFRDEPSSVVSTIASPSSFPTAPDIVLGQDVVERGPSRVSRPRRSSASISNGSTASSTGTADGARTGASDLIFASGEFETMALYLGWNVRS